MMPDELRIAAETHAVVIHEGKRWYVNDIESRWNRDGEYLVAASLVAVEQSTRWENTWKAYGVLEAVPYREEKRNVPCWEIEAEDREAVRAILLKQVAEKEAAKAKRLTEDSHDSVKTLMACDSRDWSKNSSDAWLYGVVCGWHDDLSEVAAKHGWSKEDEARLARLYKDWKRR